MDILLIDGDNVFRRFWHANPETAMASWRGMLIGYQHRLNVPRCHVVTVFDGEDTREHGVAGYKANRKEPDPAVLRDLLEAEKIAANYGKVIKHDGTEGDQVMGGIVRWSTANDHHVWLLSSDKDMLQLVRDTPPGVVVIRPMPGAYTPYTEATVRKIFSVTPSQIASYLTLVGDSSDNLKGVPGVGPKGAVYLLSKFKNLADIYRRLDQVEIKYRLLLEAAQDTVLPTYQLVKLHYPEVPLALVAPTNANRLARMAF